MGTWHRTTRLLTLAGYVGLRCLTLQRGWHLDEFATLEVLACPSFAAAMAWVRRDPHHPGFFALLYAWQALGHRAAWLRALPLAFELTTLGALAAALGRRRPGAWRYAAALGLWGANPLALRFASELRPYSALMATSVWTLAAAHRSTTPSPAAAPGGWRWPVATALAACACVAMHPVGIFAVAGALGATGARRPRQLGQLVPAGLGAGGAFALLHWGFTLDPNAARISWLPPLSAELVGRIVSVCFGLEDSTQYGALSQLAYAGGLTGAALAAGLVASAFAAGGLGAEAAGAAVLSFAAVVAYSACKQPIFWYRAIAPSAVWACAGAAWALAGSRRRLPLLLAGALVAWQVGMFWPLAGRAVDPTQQAATLALALQRPGEPLYVFPTWLATCLQPFATPAQLARVVPLQQAAAAPAPAPGIALVRCNVDLLAAPDGLAAALAALPQGAAPLREVVLIHDDNDDLSPASQRARRQVVAALQAARPSCRPLSPDNARILRLRCDA